jgi:hypothetical protein
VLAVQRAAHNLHVASGRGGDRRAPRHPRVHVFECYVFALWDWRGMLTICSRCFWLPLEAGAL